MIEKRMTQAGEARYDVRVRGTDGKERSRTFRTRKEAERFERAHHTAIDRGVWVDPRAGRVTLTAWATEWQRTVVHLRPKTLKAHDVNLRNHILPSLGEYELAKLTPSLLRAWLSDVSAKTGRGQRKIAAGTVAQAYRTLNRVLSAAVHDELIGRNPLQGVKPPRPALEPVRFLTPDEVATLAGTIDDRYRAFVLVAAYSGLRAGELIALRRSNVDLLRRTVTVIEQVQYIDGRYLTAPPKSAAGRRSVALPRVVAEELEKHLLGLADHSVDALVFTAPEGGFLHLENFRKRVWNPAVAAAGLAPLRIHDMRHTCASLAIAAGADVKVLQRMLGHSSAALTLDRYGHLMPGQAEGVADRLDVLARAAKPVVSASVAALRATGSP
ncbi:MAG: tyrosine-type recombinase/integrase [Acidimicrobiia bacterium]